MTGRSLIRVTLMLAASLLLQACSSAPGEPKPGAEAPRPDAVLDFPTLYRQNCAGCHGAEGSNGPAYPLANPEYQALVDEDRLRDVVAHGDPGTLMPAFAASAGGMLTGDQVNVLVTGMRTAWYKPQALAAANPPPYRSAVQGNASAGQQVYSTYCSSCHGNGGEQASLAGADRSGKAGSVTNPDFLAMVSDEVLRTIIIAGRPDIGQPDWRNDLPGHPMSDQEVTDVVAWLASHRPPARALVSPTEPKSAKQTPASGTQHSKKTGKGLE